MIHNVLRTLGGIDRYGILSLCLFVTIFTLVLIWALAQKRAHLERMARVPLDNDPEDSLLRRNSHE
jgi:hypothetical protein